jgi:4'-phosphopantetheinyl transferase
MSISRLPQIVPNAPWPHIDLPGSLGFGDADGAEVHVWATHCDTYKPDLHEYFLGMLSAQETARASKFRTDESRHEFLVAHAMLRSILARYLARAPERVRLTESFHGKLACEDAPELAFNLAHAQGAVLVAIGNGIDVGVDVEQVRSFNDAADLVGRYFSGEELQRFLGLEEVARNRAFFELWTRKEAYLKALGVGLSEPMDSSEVTFGAGEPFRLLRGRPGPWSMFGLEPLNGFVGALAVRGRVTRLAGGVLQRLPNALG